MFVPLLYLYLFLRGWEEGGLIHLMAFITSFHMRSGEKSLEPCFILLFVWYSTDNPSESLLNLKEYVDFNIFTPLVFFTTLFQVITLLQINATDIYYNVLKKPVQHCLMQCLNYLTTKLLFLGTISIFIENQVYFGKHCY